MKRSKRLGIGLGLGLGLMGLVSCASMAKFLDSPVPTGDLEAAVTAATTLESSADTYLAYCTPVVQPAGCDNKVIQGQLVPDVAKLQSARNAAQAWLKANNGATWVSADIFNTLESAISAINSLGISEIKS